MFHAKDGLCFYKREDGGVIVSRNGKIMTLLDIDTWISVITSMSAIGDTAENNKIAERFHIGILK